MPFTQAGDDATSLDPVDAVISAMRRSSLPQPEKIQQLLAAGRAVAEGFLRDNGQVPPMMLAFSDDGMILHSATSTTHPQVKDDFAGACRLLARANRCTAVVLILEAWARLAPPGGAIDTDIRPSTAPDRIEVVSLNAEIPGQGYLAMHEIQRDKDGKFFSLGEDRGIATTDMHGRFAGILPTSTPTDIEAEVARKVLRSFGINPDGTRINPLWN